MAQRGRTPKPTAIKQLEGNPGKRRLNANEPKPKAKAPSCPKWLEDDAKKEWRRLAKQMEQLARWKAAEEFISKHGAIVKTPSGYWQQVPQVSIAQQYLKQMGKFCEQFGLTPASRSRIVSDSGTDNSDDTMEQLLSLDGEKK